MVGKRGWQELKKVSNHGVTLLPPHGVILGLGTVCELASKYGSLALGPRTNNLFRRNISFYSIETKPVLQRMAKRAACPLDTRCLSWVPGLKNLNARSSQKVFKPRMTPGGGEKTTAPNFRLARTHMGLREDDIGLDIEDNYS